MSMFESDWTMTGEDQPEIAPGPAAFSANGNGPGAAPEPPTDSVPFGPSDATIEWIANAPAQAVLAIAIAGATFTLLFLAIAKAIRNGGESVG